MPGLKNVRLSNIARSGVSFRLGEQHQRTISEAVILNNEIKDTIGGWEQPRKTPRHIGRESSLLSNAALLW